MSGKSQSVKAFFSAFIIWTICLNALPVKAQDIVTSEDISGGSSVFVFRQSRKTAQPKAAFRNGGLNRSAAQKNEAHRKLAVQATTVAKVQRARTKAVDPNAIAIVKTPKARNGKVTPVSDMQNSELAAGAAETYLDRNDYNSAIADFNTALDFNQKNEKAKLGLSEAYARKADESFDKASPQAAIDLYQQAIKFNNKNASAYAGLGAAFELTNDNEKARSFYEKALLLNPNLTEIHAPLGILYYQKGEIAKADDYLTKAATKNQNDPDTRYYLGLVRFKQNRNDEAIAALSQTVKDRPDSAEAHYYLGALYDRVDRDKDSLAEYNRAVQIKPDYLEAWFDLGVANYNRGNYEESVTDYNQVIKLKSDYDQAYYNLAENYRQMAMSIPYQEITVPKNARAALNDSNRKRAEYFAQANSKYEIAALTITKDADLYSNWAFCLARLAKWNLAVEKLNMAISLNPDAANYTNLGWAYYNAAQVDTRVKKDDSSAKAKLQLGKVALQKAVELNPKYLGAFLNLGVTSTDLGDYQGSVNALKTAVNLYENSNAPNKAVGLAVNNELGLAYRQLNDLENAVSQFKKATQLDDNFAAGWYNLGEAEYRRGNIKEAKKAQDKLNKLKVTNLSKSLDIIIRGGVLTNSGNELKNKIQDKNPLNKIPRNPF